MLKFHKKRELTVRNWHSRALLINLKKTKISIVGSETASPIEYAQSTGTTSIPYMTNNEGSDIDYFADNQTIIDAIFGATVSFVPVDE